MPVKVWIGFNCWRVGGWWLAGSMVGALGPSSVSWSRFWLHGLIELYNNAMSVFLIYQFISVAQSCLTLRPHESQHARPPCPSPTPRLYPNSCPSSQWCHPAISSSVIPFSSYLQPFPASGFFQMSKFFCISWPKYWSFSFNIRPSS